MSSKRADFELLKGVTKGVCRDMLNIAQPFIRC